MVRNKSGKSKSVSKLWLSVKRIIKKGENE